MTAIALAGIGMVLGSIFLAAIVWGIVFGTALAFKRTFWIALIILIVIVVGNLLPGGGVTIP